MGDGKPIKAQALGALLGRNRVENGKPIVVPVQSRAAVKGGAVAELLETIHAKGVRLVRSRGERMRGVVQRKATAVRDVANTIRAENVVAVRFPMRVGDAGTVPAVSSPSVVAFRRPVGLVPSATTEARRKFAEMELKVLSRHGLTFSGGNPLRSEGLEIHDAYALTADGRRLPAELIVADKNKPSFNNPAHAVALYQLASAYGFEDVVPAATVLGRHKQPLLFEGLGSNPFSGTVLRRSWPIGEEWNPNAGPTGLYTEVQSAKVAVLARLAQSLSDMSAYRMPAVGGGEPYLKTCIRCFPDRALWSDEVIDPFLDRWIGEELPEPVRTAILHTDYRMAVRELWLTKPQTVELLRTSAEVNDYVRTNAALPPFQKRPPLSGE